MTVWNHLIPYDELPDVPEDRLESREVMRACADARAALEGLRQVTKVLPNPGVLISALPLLEAQASSAIENVVTTRDALFRSANDLVGADAATGEALRYRDALALGASAIASGRPIATVLAEQLCSCIRRVETPVRRGPGTVLASGGKVIYTPPGGERRVRALLTRWERFVHGRSGLDPLLRMAAAHYQFEAIHPFTDGNGRTGRILNLLILVERGLLEQPVLHLSRYILRHRAEYYRRLLAVTAAGDWDGWLRYMLAAVGDTARWTTSRVDAIARLHDATAIEVRRVLPKIYSRELIDVLFTQPYCRIGDLVAAGVAKRQTASTYLQALATAGLLEVRVAGREKLFVNTRFMALLAEGDEPRG
ncbi:MAG: Fic/DOC family N-terminal domain-containing protein [Kofleriaceae bacterium]